MNVRLSRNSVRFRISQDEFETLCSAQSLLEMTIFPGHCGISYDLSVVRSESGLPGKLFLSFNGNHLSLALARDVLMGLASQPVAKDSAVTFEYVTDQGLVWVSLEIDIRGRSKVSAAE